MHADRSMGRHARPAAHTNLPGLAEQVKAGDWGKFLLGALDDVVELGVDEIGDAAALAL